MQFLLRSRVSLIKIILKKRSKTCAVYSTVKRKKTVTKKNKVLISKSTCIYENLALEDWLYKHADLKKENYLLMWRNTAAVVVGRHQNPWAECDVNRAVKERVDIARRNSGGGTVYHDKGNLNMSFLTSRDIYDRRRNLNFVKEAITSRWDVDLQLNCRDDMILNEFYKISGTAAKLGGDRSYHHFTLLINVDKNNVQHFLQSPLQTRVKTRATNSVASNIMNLQDVEDNMDVSSVMDVISDKFLQNETVTSADHVKPTEQDYPGFTQIVQELKSFLHIYGRTPDFTIDRQFVSQDNPNIRMDIAVSIKKGFIENVAISTTRNCVRKEDIITKITSVPYNSLELLPLLSSLEKEIVKDSSVSDVAFYIWIFMCLKQTLNIVQ